MIKIYHNPRCSKSREGLAILQEGKEDFEIIEYMKHPLSMDEIKELIEKLNIKPIDLVRKNEEIWKEKYAGKEMSDNQIIEAMSLHPRLIERPIVVKDNQAVIGRPPTLIKKLL